MKRKINLHVPLKSKLQKALAFMAKQLCVYFCGSLLVSQLVACAKVSKPLVKQTDIKTIVLGAKVSAGQPAPAKPGVNVPAIKVNTVGFPVGWRKIAVFNVDPRGAIIKDSTGEFLTEVVAAQISKFGEDKASLDQVWQVAPNQ